MPQDVRVALAMSGRIARRVMNDEHWARLDALCYVLDRDPLRAFDDDRAARLLARTELLLTGWGCPRIDAAVLDRAPALRAIVHAAGTVKGHVAPVCWERGIQVTSAAAANAVPVAEFTLAAILFANKQAFALRERYRELRAGRDWGAEAGETGNYRRVIGIVGASMVGRGVLELLRGFDLSVLLYDPFATAEEAAGLHAEKVDLAALMARSDVVSLHAPSLPQTRGMIGARELAAMRDGATIINTARGALVDHAALEAEVSSGRINAILDTTEPEVVPADSPLYTLPNVFLTPHIAGAMGRETWRLTDLALDEIERYARGEPFRYGIALSDLARLA